jgi:hypothetical protein
MTNHTELQTIENTIEDDYETAPEQPYQPVDMSMYGND